MSQEDTNVDQTTSEAGQAPVKPAKDPVRKWTYITLVTALMLLT